MTNNETIHRLRTASNADELESAVEAATDFVSVNGLSQDELREVFLLCLSKIRLSQDRETVLHLLSECSVAMGSVNDVDIDSLVQMSTEFSPGETLHLINIVANCEDAKYIPFLKELAELEDEEISIEAEQALVELKLRSKR